MFGVHANLLFHNDRQESHRPQCSELRLAQSQQGLSTTGIVNSVPACAAGLLPARGRQICAGPLQACAQRLSARGAAQPQGPGPAAQADRVRAHCQAHAFRGVALYAGDCFLSDCLTCSSSGLLRCPEAWAAFFPELLAYFWRCVLLHWVGGALLATGLPHVPRPLDDVCTLSQYSTASWEALLRATFLAQRRCLRKNVRRNLMAATVGIAGGGGGSAVAAHRPVRHGGGGQLPGAAHGR